ncbi:MAG: DNA gyrase subunit A [Leptospirales bacterium]
MDNLHPQETTVSIDEEIRTAYLNYSMSVIVGRALPDARDGLKPVQRRVLFAMHEMGVRPGTAYRKSARIVGDVIGKYHPHGDTAVYDTAVRLVQPFTLRYPLIDGQGNFGSVDGDAPAAMRYTEIRLTRLAEEMMGELDEETVDWSPNYDESMEEPRVLPASLPLLLLNGSSGIAVGMATNIPPHNITEVLGALLHLIDNPEATDDDLMEFVTGPDFPTGGVILGRSGIDSAYRTGRGSIVMRGVVDVEDSTRSDRQCLVVREIPYLVNKARLIEKIADLVREKKIEHIADIRDESDRDGMRIVIDLRREAIPRIIMNQLFLLTPLQSSFGYNAVSIVNGRPETLALSQTLRVFLNFRKDVVTRRTLFRLRKARDRFHILEGLRRAIDLIDEIIALIRRSGSPEEARNGLVTSFAFSELQAQAILDLRLQRLTGLEREKIEAEYREVAALIASLEAILSSRENLLEVIRTETRALLERFGDARRTVVVPDEGDLTPEALIPDEPFIVTLSYEGYIKRMPDAILPTQRRGGKGRIGVTLKDDDCLIATLTAQTHDTLLFFTDLGKVYRLKTYELPEAQRTARGKHLLSLLSLSPDERVAAIVPVRSFDGDNLLLFGTIKGYFKKTRLSEYANIRQGGLIATVLEDGDRLARVLVLHPDRRVLVATRRGMSIRFHADSIRPTGRATRGVRSIRLAADDSVVSFEEISDNDFLLVTTEKGFGKRVDTNLFRLQKRGGKGVRIAKVTEETGAVVAILKVTDRDDIDVVTDSGRAIRIPSDQVRMTGRNAKGVRLVNLSDTPGEVIVCAAVNPKREPTPLETLLEKDPGS